MKHLKVILSILVCLSLIFLSDTVLAQSKIVKKTVKKVVSPQIAPMQPPKINSSMEVVPEIPAPPAPSFEVNIKDEYKGIFGWNINADLTANLLSGNETLLGLGGNIIFSDPLLLGEKIGLAQDAVEYKVGLLGCFSSTFKTIPLSLAMVTYLKEGSFFGQDPYIEAGILYNLLGTGRVSGGLGGQLRFGILSDFGLGDSKTGIALGIGTYKVAQTHSANGIFIAINQPIKL